MWSTLQTFCAATTSAPASTAFTASATTKLHLWVMKRYEKVQRKIVEIIHGLLQQVGSGGADVREDPLHARRLITWPKFSGPNKFKHVQSWGLVIEGIWSILRTCLIRDLCVTCSGLTLKKIKQRKELRRSLQAYRTFKQVRCWSSGKTPRCLRGDPGFDSRNIAIIQTLLKKNNILLTRQFDEFFWRRWGVVSAARSFRGN